MLVDKVEKITGKLTLTFRNRKTGEIRRYIYDNLYVTTGKNAIAQRMVGDSGAGEITYCALGTGTTAPAASDTQLQTEIVRKLISVRSVSGNVATFQTFFNASEGNGVLKEAGLFGNATGALASSTPNSGQLYAHTAINRTKTSSDTLTLSWAVTIN